LGGIATCGSLPILSHCPQGLEAFDRNHNANNTLRQSPKTSDAESGAADPKMADLRKIWPKLPEDIRQAILDLAFKRLVESL